jgi:hypothetical protein
VHLGMKCVCVDSCDVLGTLSGGALAIRIAWPEAPISGMASVGTPILPA